MKDFLEKLPDSSLKCAPIATFDTRISTRFVGIFGFAARRMGKDLKARGANLIVPPEGLFVAAPKGPLKDGEADRAADWAKKIIEAGKFQPDI